jgi:protein-S-isoprenylcysteine O-methyltransferase Ste14
MLSGTRYEAWVDFGEKILFAVIFSMFFVEFAWSFIDTPNIITGLYLADQTLVMLFLLFRRAAQQISSRPMDYVIAAAGTLLPLAALPPSANPIAPMWLCVLLLMAGLLLHLAAKLSLRRSFGIVAADRGIKVEGPYRFVRHPMYLGYILVHLALLLAGPLWWNAAVFAVTWIAFLLRISAEERVLSHNAEYRAFQGKTRFRLIPGVY